MVDFPFKYSNIKKVLNINPDKLRNGELKIVKDFDIWHFKFDKYILLKDEFGNPELYSFDEFLFISKFEKLNKWKSDGYIDTRTYENIKRKYLNKFFY